MTCGGGSQTESQWHLLNPVTDGYVGTAAISLLKRDMNFREFKRKQLRYPITLFWYFWYKFTIKKKDMLSYKDKTFCSSKVEVHTCGREFTKQDEHDAEQWWGDKNYPVAFGEFCEQHITNVTK